MSDVDRLVAFCKVVSTTVGEHSGSILLNLRGDSAGDTDNASAEQSTDEPIYGALGVLSRARAADTLGHAEAIALRTDDGLPTVALRDLRITRARGNVAHGAVSLAGYGGGFVGIDDAPTGTGSIVTVYAPYQHDGEGIPAKAHVVTLDTTTGNEAVILAHAEGHSVILTAEGKVLIKNKAGDVFLSVEDDGTVFSGDVKLTNNLLAGNTALVQDVALAAPLVAVLKVAGPMIAAIAAAVNGLAPGSISPADLVALNAAVALYLTPAAGLVPAAALTRTTKIQGEPG